MTIIEGIEVTLGATPTKVSSSTVNTTKFRVTNNTAGDIRLKFKVGGSAPADITDSTMFAKLATGANREFEVSAFEAEKGHRHPLHWLYIKGTDTQKVMVEYEKEVKN